MKMYIASELLKEKREKHIYLGAISILMCLILTLSNFYKLTQRASVLDLYCDNMEFIFYNTIVYCSLYDCDFCWWASIWNYLSAGDYTSIISKICIGKISCNCFFSTITMVLPSLVYAIIIGIRGYDFLFTQLLFCYW